ncbi:MAG: hypothetical protein HF978_11400 [Desulfobacteraceae bacterium]|nr:hypothetical protein [Desulfobacteraceae bacterium]MBC2756142.1 hypothetical protein [Desulfobacteraceae bacterium]
MGTLRILWLAVVVFTMLGCLGPDIPKLDAGTNITKNGIAPWDIQLSELGYRLFQNSSINVIYGVNLTREQAVKLRELAKEVESKGIKKPDITGIFASEVEQVRKTFMQIEKNLFEREEITDELTEELVKARTLESSFLRAGLTAPIKDEQYLSCRRCHARPEIIDGKISYNTDAEEWKTIGKKAKSRAVKKEMAISHLSVILRDRKEFAFIKEMGKKVADILTDNQKEVVGSFSCCLVPPRSLSDPVRVGQADVTEWQIETLEKVRNCPGVFWPIAEKRALDRIEKATLVVDPGMTEKKLKEGRERVGKIFDKARSLSDVDFEMEKEELAAQIKLSTPEIPEHLRDFNSAFFLLLPGSVEVYDKLIEHIDSQKSLDEENKKDEESKKGEEIKKDVENKK